MSLELSGTTGVKGVAGSVSAPSIVGDDTNTGISFPSADTIKFSTGGVERMSITNSGITGTGVSMIDTYNLTSSQGISNGGWNYLKTNFSRVNGDLGNIRVTALGTGLTADNSGSATTFSFPSTGYYELTFTTNFTVSTSASAYYIYTSIWTTDDGSNFDNTVNVLTNVYGNSSTIYATAVANVIMDVQNTSNDKFYLAVLPETNANMLGNSGSLYTYLQVKKLAET